MIFRNDSVLINVFAAMGRDTRGDVHGIWKTQKSREGESKKKKFGFWMPDTVLLDILYVNGRDAWNHLHENKRKI